ncbi:MAG: Por secretion system C-terminal sorting protein [Candidatus Krumholzibacteriota bacterium]|nr:Por secretion system C-terminal sorting protein [Candidatus Krumholzibacteriota bacterium]
MTTGGSSVREKLLVAASGAVELWTVIGSEPWISVDKTAGATPDTIVVTMDPSGLPAGTHAGALHFASGGTEFDVPVELELFTMTLSKMTTDLTRPYIYALHPGDGNFGPAYLLFVNTQTENVERVIPIGMDPTDMTVHSAEGRLYVTNWTHPVTRVVDLAAQKEISPLGLGNDVYRLNAGRSGRIYFEGVNPLEGKIVNTATGLLMGTVAPIREGDAEIGPAGSFYYHCDYNISNAAIHKFDIRTDRPTEIATSIQHPDGARNLVLSGDGKRLFWQGYMYDQNLNEMRTLGEEIYATTLHGELAFGANHVFDTLYARLIYTFQFSTTVMAVSGDQQKLFMYKPLAHRIVVIPIDEILAVPVFVTRFDAVPSEGRVELSWETIADEGVRGFNVYRRGEDEEAPALANAEGLIPAGESKFVDRDIRGGRRYEYTLGVVVEDGTEIKSQAVSVTAIAYELALHQNRPNPFNPTTTIPFTLPERARVTLSIYDVGGRLVRTLADEVMAEGRRERVWDGKDTKGNTVSSGVYFYCLSTGDKSLTRKMVVLR